MASPSTNPGYAPAGTAAGTGTAAQDALLLVARILLAYIFIKSGYGKLTNISGFAAGLASRGVPMANVLGIVAPFVEFFGGLAILLGFMTRYAAALMILFVISASATSHRFWEFADAAARRGQELNFDKNLCIIGGFLLLIAVGGGRLGIDGLWRR